MKSACLYIIASIMAGSFLLETQKIIAQETPLYTLNNKNDYKWVDHHLKTTDKIGQQNIDSIIRLYKELLSSSLKLNYKHGVIISSWRLGALYFRKGRYDETIYFYNKAISWCDTISDCDTLSSIYTDIGHAYAAKAMYEEAADNYIKAVRYSELGIKPLRPPAHIYNNLYNVMVRLRRYEQSRMYFQKAMDYAGINKDSAFIAALLNNMGIALAQSNQYGTSRKYFDSAIGIQRRLNVPRALYNSLMNLSNVYIEERLLDSALVLLQEANVIAEKLQPMHEIRYKTTLMIGKVLLDKKDYKNAEKYLSAILDSGKDIIPNHRLNLLEYTAALYEATGRPAKANALLHEYITLKDSIEGKDVALKVSELEAQYRSAEKDKEITQGKLLITERDKKLATQRLWIIGTGSLLTLVILSALTYYQFRKRKLHSEREIERLKGVIEGEEKERERLAHELHDGVNSQLAVARMLLHKMQINYNHDYETLDKMADVIESTDREVRKVAHNLAPDELMMKGLPATIENYCADIFSESGILADVQVYDTFEDLPLLLQLNIYRIVQELTHNIVKHAEATEVTLLLHKENREIALTIDDNGNGIANGNTFNGIGLSSIQERIKAYNGSFQIDSSPGKGTHIQIRLLMVNFQ